MRVLRNLQDRVSRSGRVQRVVVIDAASDGSSATAVVVWVPPRHKFPLHLHPASEDCFFILSGTAEILSPQHCVVVDELSGVWVPPGVPHGLVAGAQGILELGVQSPPGPTIGHTGREVVGSRKLSTASIARSSSRLGRQPRWQPVFDMCAEPQVMTVRFGLLCDRTQSVEAVAGNDELLLAVVRGSVQIAQVRGDLQALSILQLRPGEAMTLHGSTEQALLLEVRLSTANEQPSSPSPGGATSQSPWPMRTPSSAGRRSVPTCPTGMPRLGR